MFFVADFHLHSRYARATSKEMNLENLCLWGQLKGVKVLSAADFTHPLWFSELKEKLIPAEPGLFRLPAEIEKKIAHDVPESCRQDTRFILTTEISSIYSKKGRTRKVHNLVFAPSLETAQKINNRLSLVGNLRADGRPILGLDSKELLKIILDIDRDCLLVPAHAWTPHFSVFGSNSGFDSLEECFEELTPYIYAIETGLSSDPEMNWRLSKLDAITLISNSDSHSLPKIAREANVFDTEVSYPGIIDALNKAKAGEGKKLLMTIEFFPEEGKYHYDGHRNCGVRLEPHESLKVKNICPACGKPLTIGVMHRVEKLADRELGERPEIFTPFKRVIPLAEIIGEAFDQAPLSRGVLQEYRKLLFQFGNELKILLKIPIEEIKKFTHPLVTEGIRRMRENRLTIEPGFDGEYGTVHIFSEKERNATGEKQTTLF